MSVLKLRQFALISQKHKNEMMDRYYDMRTMDRSIQLMHKYEEDVGVDPSIQQDFNARRRQVIMDIYKLLPQLNLPHAELKQYIAEMPKPP